MYREPPAFELRCPRGHLHKEGAAGGYCTIPPCQGMADWYADLYAGGQVSEVVHLRGHGPRAIRKVFPPPAPIAREEEHQQPLAPIPPPPPGRWRRARLALAAVWRWAFPPPPTCEDCQEVLRGPEIEYSGRGIRRLHFGNVCIACHLKRARKDDLEFIARMRKE